MSERELILEAARFLRSELSALLESSDVRSFDDKVARILINNAIDADEQVCRLVIEKDSTFRRFNAIKRRLEPTPDGTRSWDLAGDLAAEVPTESYRCPHNDFCWFRQSVDESIPKCPWHPDDKLKLVQSTNTKR
jgi:hypothetical protein